jgi:hypothetical protein
MANHNSVPEPELIDKELKVLELRRMGMTWQKIAEQVGYADHTGAYAAYKRAMKRTLQQPADELRNAELDRIDRLQMAAWGKAMQGEIGSIHVIVRLMERRARLLGLDMPIRAEMEVIKYDGVRLRADTEQLLNRLRELDAPPNTLGEGSGENGTDTE